MGNIRKKRDHGSQVSPKPTGQTPLDVKAQELPSLAPCSVLQAHWDSLAFGQTREGQWPGSSGTEEEIVLALSFLT